MKRILPLLALFAIIAPAHETLTTTVLFDREIVRILNQHCVMCHAENGPSFPLETYEQTWLQGRKVRAEVIARHMPPWAAVSGYGQFANDNSLTLRETQFIVSWVEGLGPRNSGTVFANIAGPDAARPKDIRAHADFGKWQLGEPSLKLQLPSNTIEPQSGNQVKRVVIEAEAASGRAVRGIEFMPSDRRVVRAAFFTIRETGQWIGSWTPWYGFTSLPKGTAFRLPVGAHIVVEIYYTAAKERITERGTLGLFFSDSSAPESVVKDIALEAKTGSQERVRATTRLTAATYALALRPEVGPGTKSIEVSARRPDGTTEVLLYAKDLPQDWPSPYIFKDPVFLPKGAELSVTAYYSGAPGGIRLTMSEYQK